jgi:hypothetical protein
LRLELGSAVTRHIYLDLTALASESFAGGSIARVAGVLTFRRVFLIAEVVREFTFESALYEGFGELLKQAVLAQEVVW